MNDKPHFTPDEPDNRPPVDTDAGEWEPGGWLAEFAICLPVLVAVCLLAKWVSQ